MTAARKLTKDEAAQVRQLMLDSGWSAKEARALVLSGFAETLPEPSRIPGQLPAGGAR